MVVKYGCILPTPPGCCIPDKRGRNAPFAPNRSKRQLRATKKTLPRPTHCVLDRPAIAATNLAPTITPAMESLSLDRKPRVLRYRGDAGCLGRRTRDHTDIGGNQWRTRSFEPLNLRDLSKFSLGPRNFEFHPQPLNRDPFQRLSANGLMPGIGELSKRSRLARPSGRCRRLNQRRLLSEASSGLA
jgi:hypothetical protein